MKLHNRKPREIRQTLRRLGVLDEYRDEDGYYVVDVIGRASGEVIFSAWAPSGADEAVVDLACEHGALIADKLGPEPPRIADKLDPEPPRTAPVPAVVTGGSAPSGSKHPDQYVLKLRVKMADLEAARWEFGEQVLVSCPGRQDTEADSPQENGPQGDSSPAPADNIIEARRALERALELSGDVDVEAALREALDELDNLRVSVWEGIFARIHVAEKALADVECPHEAALVERARTAMRELQELLEVADPDEETEVPPVRIEDDCVGVCAFDDSQPVLLNLSSPREGQRGVDKLIATVKHAMLPRVAPPPKERSIELGEVELPTRVISLIKQEREEYLSEFVSDPTHVGIPAEWRGHFGADPAFIDGMRVHWLADVGDGSVRVWREEDDERCEC